MNYLNDEQKKIVEAFNELMPWDRGDLMKHLVEKEMSEEEIEKYFIEGSGYVKEDEIDVVKEVLDNNLEYEVFNELYYDYICDYLLEGSDAQDVTNYIFSHSNPEHIAEALAHMNSYDLSKVFELMWKNHKKDCERILDNILK